MYILEQCAFATVFAWRLERRKMTGKQKAAAFAIAALLVIFGFSTEGALKYGESYMSTGDYRLRAAAGSLLVCSVLFVLITMLLHIVNEISVYEAIYTMTCAYMGEHIAYCLRVLIEWLTGTGLVNAENILLYFAINTMVAFVCYRWYAVPMIYKRHYVAPPRETIILLFMATLVIMEMSSVANVYGFTKLHAVYALIFSAFMLYSQVERQKAGMVIIREENPTENVLKVEQGRAVTTKEDAENHGLGLRSMEMAAEKYDGSLTFKVEDGVFMLSAVFVP